MSWLIGGSLNAGNNLSGGW